MIRYPLAFILLVLVFAGCNTTSRITDHSVNIPDRENLTIHRDNWGVPHIFGASNSDAAFGLAYAHAEDDFATIQTTLLASRARVGYYLMRQ